MSPDLISLLPVLSLVVAALAVFFGPFVSWFVAKKQIEASIRVSNKQVIAPIRQAWINELRILLAELTGKCAHYWAAGYEDREDAEYQHITELVSKLTLYINPTEQDHISLLEKVKEMESAISSGGSTENDKLFWSAHEASVKLGQTILKREWERVKNEI
jgi:hypothetical protein